MFLVDGSWTAQQDFPTTTVISTKAIYKWGRFGLNGVLRDIILIFHVSYMNAASCRLQKGISAAWFLACALNRQISQTIYFKK
jgi:hypothetical protein